MISISDGVGSLSDAKGSAEKNAQIFSERVRPKLPAFKRISAVSGDKGIKTQAIIPTMRDQVQIRGSTNKLLSGATREILLK